jgi:hypothetical protein
LRQRLRQAGYAVSVPTIRRLLKAHGFSLRVNAKANSRRSFTETGGS